MTQLQIVPPGEFPSGTRVSALSAAPASGSWRLQLAEASDLRPSPASWSGEGDRQRYDRYTRQHTALDLLALEDATVFGLGQVAVAERVLPRALRAGDEVLSLNHELQRKTEAYEVDHDARVVRLNPDLKPIQPASHGLLLAQPGFRSYGHFLLDVLPKLSVVPLCEAPLKLVFHYQPEPWQETLLGYLGFTREQMLIYNPRRQRLRFRKLFVCSQHRHVYCLHPGANAMYEQLRAAVLSDAKPDDTLPRKLYCAPPRTSDTSRLLNAAAVQTFLEARGFFTIRPDELSFERQVQMFDQAQWVVGAAGSALHNTVFSPKGTRVLVLMSDHPEAQRFAQAGIGAVRQQPTGFLFGAYAEEQDLAQTGRVFSICLSALEGALDELSQASG